MKTPSTKTDTKVLRDAVTELDMATGYRFARIAVLKPHDYRDMVDLALAHGHKQLAERLRKGA